MIFLSHSTSSAVAHPFALTIRSEFCCLVRPFHSFSCHILLTIPVGERRAIAEKVKGERGRGVAGVVVAPLSPLT